ncbi:hypothetical protein C6Y14_14135 [Streptomyces dioscori]|uniref:SDR family oxidoreductase n=1 Tax=Streptomyces dioscori TaxID=2109333 RepID=A0A2P8Q7Z3_9ACTN|nr:SDR family oxidoreductase [Streptomyces dioscori]PSM42371.1 hypothetical protein C6Y14_14135 [Streptomyces dioscori]
MRVCGRRRPTLRGPGHQRDHAPPRSAGHPLRQRGSRVNVLSPGPVDTPATYVSAGAHDAAGRRQVRDRMSSLIPLARIGRPEEVAAAVFLASARSSFTTGA